MPAKRIFIIDDDPSTIGMLQSLLRVEGYEVESAVSGEAALHRILAEPPDAILLDVMLPGMDGHDVARAIRAAPTAAHVPIILLTSRRDRQDVALGAVVGACVLLHKPFACRQLLQTLQAAVAPPPAQP